MTYEKPSRQEMEAWIDELVADVEVYRVTLKRIHKMTLDPYVKELCEHALGEGEEKHDDR